MNNKQVSKLFSVLVLGGAVMAQAQEVPTPEEKDDLKTCKVSVKEKEFNIFAPDGAFVIETCVDEKTDEEILEIVKKAKEPEEAECMSPFCGCWLG